MGHKTFILSLLIWYCITFSQSITYTQDRLQLKNLIGKFVAHWQAVNSPEIHFTASVPASSPGIFPVSWQGRPSPLKHYVYLKLPKCYRLRLAVAGTEEQDRELGLGPGWAPKLNSFQSLQKGEIEPLHLRLCHPRLKRSSKIVHTLWKAFCKHANGAVFKKPAGPT